MLTSLCCFTSLTCSLRDQESTEEAAINMGEENEPQSNVLEDSPSETRDNHRAYSSSSGSVSSSNNEDDDTLFERACDKAAADESSMCGHITLVVKAEINNQNPQNETSDSDAIVDISEICEEPLCAEDGVESNVLDQLDDFLGSVDETDSSGTQTPLIPLDDDEKDETPIVPKDKTGNDILHPPIFSDELMDTGNLSEESSCGSNDEKLCSAHFELEKKRMVLTEEITNDMMLGTEKDQQIMSSNKYVETDYNFCAKEAAQPVVANKTISNNILQVANFAIPEFTLEKEATMKDFSQPIEPKNAMIKTKESCADAVANIANHQPKLVEVIEKVMREQRDAANSIFASQIMDENNNNATNNTNNLCDELIEAENELYHMSINHMVNEQDGNQTHDYSQGMLEGVKQSMFSRLDITDEDEKALVSLRIEEEHLSSVALSIAKWESLSRKKGGAPRLPIQPAVYTYKGKLAQNGAKMNGNNNFCEVDRKEGSIQTTTESYSKNEEKKVCDNNNPEKCEENKQNEKNVLEVRSNNGEDKEKDKDVIITPSVIKNGLNNGCWDVWMKGDSGENGDLAKNKSDEIIYAQPNGLTGLSTVLNQAEVLKSFCKPNSKGDIINWFKEGELHRSGILLSSWGQSLPLGVVTPPPVVVSWFFGKLKLNWEYITLYTCMNNMKSKMLSSYPVKV